jgi:hypothetical protein
MQAHAMISKTIKWLSYGLVGMLLYGYFSSVSRKEETKRPALDFSRPIFTEDGAQVCPQGLMFDLRQNGGIRALQDAELSIVGRAEKFERIGCQALIGGLRVYARRMTGMFDGYVSVSLSPAMDQALFTREFNLKN